MEFIDQFPELWSDLTDSIPRTWLGEYEKSDKDFNLKFAVRSPDNLLVHPPSADMIEGRRRDGGMCLQYFNISLITQF